MTMTACHRRQEASRTPEAAGENLVDVAPVAPLDKVLTYLVPPDFSALALPGAEVTVPLGRKTVPGFIVERHNRPVVQKLREITAVVSPPRFNFPDLQFYRWIAAYYHHPLGITLNEIIPEKKEPAGEVLLGLAPGTVIPARLGTRQALLCEHLKQHGPTTLGALRLLLPGVSRVARPLIQKGLLESKVRFPGEQAEMAARPEITATDEPVLNEYQQEAKNTVAAAIAGGGYAPFLLWGVTGSGKTEIYLQAMKACLAQDKGVIYLVPEIALTTQLLERLQARFPREPIAVFHSGISPQERYRLWQEVLAGRVRVVLGARSAVFAPLPRLGLIIADEEHDPSYKQDDRLKYHARDLALVKAKQVGAVVMLGSATPDLQSYRNSAKGKYGLLILPCRVEKRPLPTVETVDLKSYGDRLPLSPPLLAAIGENLSGQGQTMLFLNRRGFNTLVICQACGYVYRCRNCSITLTYHRRPGDAAEEGELICHHCDFHASLPGRCEQCRAGAIARIGFGTARVEEELARFFPAARIARMDRDSMKNRTSWPLLRERLEEKEIDILVGTQMITKGHDFPGVTLAGVVMADLSLALPDFRAAERTFQLLTQVAGRAGRGQSPGRVIIQTFNPNHYAVALAARQDYESFYREELIRRRELAYPPFSRLVNFHLSCLDWETGRREAMNLREAIREICRLNRVEIMGPAPSPLGKLRGRHRWQLLLKSADMHALHRLVPEVLHLGSRILGLTVKVDVDPLSFM